MQSKIGWLVAGFVSALALALVYNQPPRAQVGGGTSVVAQGPSGTLGQGWLLKCDEPADTTGTLATVGDTVTEVNLDGFATVLMTAKGTYSGATWVIEFSDDNGATWLPSLASRMDLGVREPGGTLLTNATRGWVINPGPGADSVRARLTAITS